MDKLAHDLDETKQQAVVLSKMAIKDGLTGIRNKMGYNEEVERTVSELENGNNMIAYLQGLIRLCTIERRK